MKWMLFFLLPIMCQGQRLKPGIYTDLKPAKPIVLDTGSYTFINLQMKNLGKGIWLDGSKARKIEMQNCRFEGNGSGTAVLTNGEANISKSTFTNMETGIQASVDEGLTRTLNISGNRFTDLNTAISLNRLGEIENAILDFTLKCNTFENNPHTGNFTRKGLVIGEGVQLKYQEFSLDVLNTIGGSDQFNSGNQYPNANVWPTTSDRDEIPAGGIEDLNSSSGWGLSPNWVSIENSANNATINYHRFKNEFVGYGTSISGPVSFPIPGNEWIVTGNQTADPTHVKACSNFTDPVILFPVLRISVVDSLAITSTDKTIFDSPYLLDAIPNPAMKETRIELYLPGKTEQAVLQILELASGKVLQTIQIRERGKLETVLDVSKAPTGVYGYRLVSDGKPEPVKKLIVMH